MCALLVLNCLVLYSEQFILIWEQLVLSLDFLFIFFIFFYLGGERKEHKSSCLFISSTLKKGKAVILDFYFTIFYSDVFSVSPHLWYFFAVNYKGRDKTLSVAVIHKLISDDRFEVSLSNFSSLTFFDAFTDLFSFIFFIFFLFLSLFLIRQWKWWRWQYQLSKLWHW